MINKCLKNDNINFGLSGHGRPGASTLWGVEWRISRRWKVHSWRGETWPSSSSSSSSRSFWTSSLSNSREWPRNHTPSFSIASRHRQFQSFLWICVAIAAKGRPISDWSALWDILEMTVYFHSSQRENLISLLTIKTIVFIYFNYIFTLHQRPLL